MSVNCSTCFGYYLHPSSGAHIIVGYLQYLALMRPLLLPVVNVTGLKPVSIQSRSRQVAVMVPLMPDTIDTVI